MIYKNWLVIDFFIVEQKVKLKLSVIGQNEGTLNADVLSVTHGLDIDDDAEQLLAPAPLEVLDDQPLDPVLVRGDQLVGPAARQLDRHRPDRLEALDEDVRSQDQVLHCLHYFAVILLESNESDQRQIIFLGPEAFFVLISRLEPRNFKFTCNKVFIFKLNLFFYFFESFQSYFRINTKI